MTPEDAWNIETKRLPKLSNKVIMLRLEHALQIARRDKDTLESTAYQTYPEALKRPACVAKLVEWKLQGLI